MASTTAAAPTTKQALMTYSAASQLLGDSPNPKVASDTQVWVVTVYGGYGFVSVPAGDPVQPALSPFSVILDAANGSPIDLCTGCDAFKAGSN